MSAAKKLVAYSVTKSEDGKKDYFTSIGRAFTNPNKEGFTIKLNAHPIGDKIVVLAKDEDESETE